MTALDGAHVLVVGATGGLGSAICRRLAARGTRLTLTARSGERLADLADELGAAVLGTHAADITFPSAPADAVRAAVAHGPLDGVVDAAGVVAFGAVSDLDDDVLDELLLVNLVAPIRLARAAVDVLPPGGFLVNLSAVVAERPAAGMAAYSATKAGLTGFDAALAHELRRRRLRVVDVRPPHTETGLAGRPIAGEAPRLGPGLEPDVVAERVVRAIEQGETEVPASAFGTPA
ncbi:SDR family NAD(P)-dependent oxidoreductase [Cellulomonas carbonis]|uniref:Short-chain dehydrogenase n=1 Tax=Cellulomonas carbonis T26 TaxID=947969 RepID=A0A0A0BVH1_9CELL|nr:SDR family NAD(P)-dependent oxidoreductase [Cellulomonas carbonis]KGM12388.1 short-chain dehydrogenase [Cellulomonas carbonis T26]GGC03893.1 short chain dehydrogenase [Cellulomonas carbonis]